MEKSKLKGSIESLIFASEHPVKLEKLVEIIGQEQETEVERKDIREIIEEIRTDYESDERGLCLMDVAGGYQFRTKKEFSHLLQKLKAKRPPRFGRAAMEVLAIIAYRQPITRAEIEDLRGVDSGAVVRSLLEKKLVKILGKKEVPGRPMIYGTSRFFLETFGLRDLTQLPSLKEFVELEEADEGIIGLAREEDAGEKPAES